MNLIGRSWMSWCVTLTLGVQRFGISFKLMLITCVGVSLQGWNTLTCHQQCHLSESDSVELLIVWQFIDYMDSRTTFTMFFKMVPHAYESTGLICISFHLWICVWNVWFGWGMCMLWNIIVYKCILYLYNFLNVLNLLWDVSHTPSICIVCVWAKGHPCRWVSVRLWWWCYMRDLRLHFILLLILGLWMFWNNVILGQCFIHLSKD